MSDNNKNTGQHLLDHLIRQMTAGIGPQGQYSQFGYATPPDVLWPDKENNVLPSYQPQDFTYEPLRSSNSSPSSISNIYFSPISPGLNLSDPVPKSQDRPPLRRFSSHETSQILFPEVFPQADSSPKPSYSDIVSKTSSKQPTTPDNSIQNVSPTHAQTFEVFGGFRSKGGAQKQNYKGKRNSWGKDTIDQSKRKFSSRPKRSSSNSHLRRKSCDFTVSDGLENISLDDPFPQNFKPTESSKVDANESGSESTKRDLPLNNEQGAVSSQNKVSTPRKPLNINNNLCNNIKSKDRVSPTHSNVSMHVLKSCNQEEWNTLNANQSNQADSIPKPDVDSIQKPIELKSRNTRNAATQSATSFISSKSEKKHKEASNGRKRKKKTTDSFPFFDEALQKSATYLTAWLNITMAFLAWLFHLICDVSSMSSKLVLQLFLTAVEKMKLLSKYFLKIFVFHFKKRFGHIWPFNCPSKKPINGLTKNITLPTTGEEAMKRLLACRGENPYGILGVTSDCSDDDIKKFYKRQAILVHPDKNRQPGAEEAFKVLGHAFELIGESKKREEYDERTEKDKMRSTSMQEFTDLIKELHRKMEEAANTICCTNCNGKHKRQKTDRPCFCARFCKKCKINHAAREGDLWAESSFFGLFWRYYSCMDGAVYDITQWASCQSDRLKHLQANTHFVQYRIVTSGNNHGNRWNGRRPQNDVPSEEDLEDFLNSLYNQSMPGSSKTSEATHKPNSSKKKTKKRKN